MIKKNKKVNSEKMEPGDPMRFYPDFILIICVYIIIITIIIIIYTHDYLWIFSMIFAQPSQQVASEGLCDRWVLHPELEGFRLRPAEGPRCF